MNLRNIGSAAVLSLAALAGTAGCGKPEAEIPKTGSIDIDAEFSQDRFFLKTPDRIFEAPKPEYLTVPQTVEEFGEMLLLCFASADGVNAFIERSSASKIPQGCRSAQVIAGLKEGALAVCSTLAEADISDPKVQSIQQEMSDQVKTLETDIERFKAAFPDCFPGEPKPILASVDAL